VGSAEEEHGKGSRARQRRGAAELGDAEEGRGVTNLELGAAEQVHSAAVNLDSAREELKSAPDRAALAGGGAEADGSLPLEITSLLPYSSSSLVGPKCGQVRWRQGAEEGGGGSGCPSVLGLPKRAVAANPSAVARKLESSAASSARSRPPAAPVRLAAAAGWHGLDLLRSST
jgi:hypothetical protein